jgi:hypothetical protein
MNWLSFFAGLLSATIIFVVLSWLMIRWGRPKLNELRKKAER